MTPRQRIYDLLASRLDSLDEAEDLTEHILSVAREAEPNRPEQQSRMPTAGWWALLTMSIDSVRSLAVTMEDEENPLLSESVARLRLALAMLEQARRGLPVPK